MDETPVQPPPGEATMPPTSGIADANMPDAAQSTGPTEGKGFGDAYPSTEVREGGAVAAPGSGESKRRKVTPQAHIHNLFGSTLRSLSSIIDTQEVCVNCFSNEHTIEDCPKDGASEWKAALLSIQTGFASRQAEIDVEVIPDDEETPDVEHDAKQGHNNGGYPGCRPGVKRGDNCKQKGQHLIASRGEELGGDHWSRGGNQCACRRQEPEELWFQGYPPHVWRIARAYSEDQVRPTKRPQANDGSDKHVQV